jgi:hypothetical protein
VLDALKGVWWATMELAVVVAVAVGVVGLALLGLGFYFMVVTWPYLRLLQRAGRECVEIYNGCKKGEVWEVAVSVGSRSEKHWVEARELGRFMIQRALGPFYEQEAAKAKAIEAEAATALTESLLWEYVQKTDSGVMDLDKKPNHDFSSSRREILDKVGALLSGQVAFRSNLDLA